MDVTVTSGGDGSIEITQAGLVPGDVASGTLAPGQEVEYVVEVPADASFARFDLDAENDAADLDLVVYQLDMTDPENPAVVDVFVSATGSADERVDIIDPDAGVYLAYASGYANAPGESTSAYRQSNFVVGPDPADWVGALDVSPNPLPVSRGEESTFTVSWTGLDDAARYLGWVGYDGALQPTIITVN